MTFQKGNKLSGSRKGRPGRKNAVVRSILEANNVNLVEEILNDLKELPPFLRVKAYLELMKYVYPQRKAIESPPDVSIPEGYDIVLEEVRSMSEPEQLGLVKRFIEEKE